MKPVVYPSDWLMRENPPPLASFGRRLLAEGDSWFTIGTINLPRASNLLFQLELEKTTAIINCAYPGDTLQHMVDGINDPYFDRLLRTKGFASYWEAILMSCGGNDMIDAAQVLAMDSKGRAVPPERRLLLTGTESNGAMIGAERYVSHAGWVVLENYVVENFNELVRRRDSGPSKDRPIFAHTYAFPTVRPSGSRPQSKGWLYPAFEAYGIPDDARQGVADLLFTRLRDLLLSFDRSSGSARALPHVHIFDSAGVAGIVSAAPATTGESNDWINEIHLTPEGYRKLGRAWGASMVSVWHDYP